jgi:hypothetical protein
VSPIQQHLNPQYLLVDRLWTLFDWLYRPFRAGQCERCHNQRRRNREETHCDPPIKAMQSIFQLG